MAQIVPITITSSDVKNPAYDYAVKNGITGFSQKKHLVTNGLQGLYADKKIW